MFGLFRTCDNRALGTVESADDTAGNGHKEHRDDRLTGRMLVEVTPEIGKAEFIQSTDFREDSDENRDGSENQKTAKNRVDSADNFVNREESTDKVIDENGDDCAPENRRGRVAFADENRCIDKACRRVRKDCADKDQGDCDQDHHDFRRASP